MVNRECRRQFWNTLWDSYWHRLYIVITLNQGENNYFSLLCFFIKKIDPSVHFALASDFASGHFCEKKIDWNALSPSSSFITDIVYVLHHDLFVYQLLLTLLCYKTLLTLITRSEYNDFSTHVNMPATEAKQLYLHSNNNEFWLWMFQLFKDHRM